MSALLKYFDRILIDLLSPQCLVCMNFCDRSLCETCGNFERYVGRCQICGTENGSVSGICQACRTHQQGFSGVQSIFRFNSAAQKILHRIKYGRDPIWLKLFESELNLDQHLLIQGKPWIIAVPMHWTRSLKRGFNQSELLAQMLSRKYGMILGKKVLRKKRRTPPQSRLSHFDRLINLRNAFTANLFQEIPETVILVDDVTTTGSTLQACARALKKAGVEHVVGWTLFKSELRAQNP